jgi:hypothetical protein
MQITDYGADVRRRRILWTSRKALIDDIRQTVEEAVENAFAKRD